ncbi:MAG: hypothetical protein C0404_10635 [Verrucomicrobia bacterium]|nr:hypothetical protein [Verrucomicrobiota bacterium]
MGLAGKGITVAAPFATAEIFDRRCFLADALTAIRSEFETLPWRMKLALWFRTCMKFSEGETAGLLAIPPSDIGNQVAGGTSYMLAAMARRGVLTDAGSLAAALVIQPIERAPESLTRRIEMIVAGCHPGRQTKRMLFRKGNGMRAGRLREKSERFGTD